MSFVSRKQQSGNIEMEPVAIEPSASRIGARPRVSMLSVSHPLPDNTLKELLNPRSYGSCLTVGVHETTFISPQKRPLSEEMRNHAGTLTLGTQGAILPHDDLQPHDGAGMPRTRDALS